MSKEQQLQLLESAKKDASTFDMTEMAKGFSDFTKGVYSKEGMAYLTKKIEIENRKEESERKPASNAPESNEANNKGLSAPSPVNVPAPQPSNPIIPGMPLPSGKPNPDITPQQKLDSIGDVERKAEEAKKKEKEDEIKKKKEEEERAVEEARMTTEAVVKAKANIELINKLLNKIKGIKKKQEDIDNVKTDIETIRASTTEEKKQNELATKIVNSAEKYFGDVTSFIDEVKKIDNTQVDVFSNVDEMIKTNTGILDEAKTSLTERKYLNAAQGGLQCIQSCQEMIDKIKDIMFQFMYQFKNVIEGKKESDKQEDDQINSIISSLEEDKIANNTKPSINLLLKLLNVERDQFINIAEKTKQDLNTYNVNSKFETKTVEELNDNIAIINDSIDKIKILLSTNIGDEKIKQYIQDISTAKKSIKQNEIKVMSDRNKTNAQSIIKQNNELYNIFIRNLTDESVVIENKNEYIKKLNDIKETTKTKLENLTEPVTDNDVHSIQQYHYNTFTEALNSITNDEKTNENTKNKVKTIINELESSLQNYMNSHPTNLKGGNTEPITEPTVPATWGTDLFTLYKLGLRTAELENTLNDKQKENKRLRETLDEKNKQIAQNEQDREKLNREVNAKEVLLSALEQEKQSLEKLKDKSVSDIQKLLNEKSDHADALKKATDQLESEKSVLNSEIAKHQSELKTIKSEVEKLETKINNQTEEIKKIQEGNNQEVSGLQTKMSELERELQNLKVEQASTAASSATEKEALTASIKALEAEKESLQQKLDEAEKKLTSTTSELTKIRDKDITAANTALQEKQQLLNNSIAELTAQKTKYDALNKDLSQKEGEFKQVQNSLEEYEKLLATANQEISNLKMISDTKETENKAVFEKKLKDIQKDNETRIAKEKSAIEELNSQLKKKEDENKDLSLQHKLNIEKAAQDIKHKEEEIQRLNAELKKLKEDNNKYTNISDITKTISNYVEGIVNTTTNNLDSDDINKINIAKRISEMLNETSKKINDRKQYSYISLIEKSKKLCEDNKLTTVEYLSIEPSKTTTPVTDQKTQVLTKTPQIPITVNKANFKEELKKLFKFVFEWNKDIEKIIYKEHYVMMMSLDKSVILKFIAPFLKNVAYMGGGQNIYSLLILSSYWDVTDIYENLEEFKNATLTSDAITLLINKIDETDHDFINKQIIKDNNKEDKENDNRKYVFIQYFLDFCISMNKILYSFQNIELNLINIYMKIINHYYHWKVLEPAFVNFGTYLSHSTEKAMNFPSANYKPLDTTEQSDSITSIIRVRCDDKTKELTHNINVLQNVNLDQNITNTAFKIQKNDTPSTPYIFGPFTHIFTPNQGINDIVKNTSILRKIQNGENVLMFGIGVSGSGKTSTLVYRTYSEEYKKTDDYKEKHKNGEVGENGILLEILGKLNCQQIIFSSYEYYDKRVQGENNTYKAEPVKIEKTATFTKNGDGYKSNENQTLENECLNVIETNRKVSPTTNNINSSRSHVLISLKFRLKDKQNEQYILIADLAGVENKFLCNDYTTMESFSKLIKQGETRTYYAKEELIKFPDSDLMNVSDMTTINKIFSEIESNWKQLNNPQEKQKTTTPTQTQTTKFFYKDLYPILNYENSLKETEKERYEYKEDEDFTDAVKESIEIYKYFNSKESLGKTFSSNEIQIIKGALKYTKKGKPSYNGFTDYITEYQKYINNFLILPFLVKKGWIRKEKNTKQEVVINISNTADIYFPFFPYMKKSNKYHAPLHLSDSNNFRKDIFNQFKGFTQDEIHFNGTKNFNLPGKNFIRPTLSLVKIMAHDFKVLEEYHLKYVEPDHINIFKMTLPYINKTLVINRNETNPTKTQYQLNDGKTVITEPYVKEQLQNLLKKLEDYKQQVETIQKGCEERVTEGIFINNELKYFRRGIFDLLKLSTGKSNIFGNYPFFTHECLKNYSNSSIVSDNGYNSNWMSKLVNTIKTLINPQNKSENSIKLNTVIVGAINLKDKNDPNNPNLPFINIQTKENENETIIDIYNEFLKFYKIYCYNPVTDPNKVSLIKTDADIVLKYTDILKKVFTATNRVYTQIINLDKATQEKIGGFIDIIEEQKETIYEAINISADPVKVEVDESTKIPTSSLKPSHVLEFIDSIRAVNSLSIIGTVEFIDEIIKYNIPIVPCIEDESMGQKYTQSIIQKQSQSGGNNEVFLNTSTRPIDMATINQNNETLSTEIVPIIQPSSPSPAEPLPIVVSPEVPNPILQHLYRYDLPMYLTKAARVALYNHHSQAIRDQILEREQAQTNDPLFSNTHKPAWTIYLYDLVLTAVLTLILGYVAGSDSTLVQYVFVDLCISITLILLGYVVVMDMKQTDLDLYEQYITGVLITPFYLLADLS